MNKLYTLALCAASMMFAHQTSAQTVDGRNFGIDGFAALEGVSGTNWYHAGGTTGGEGGKVVYANTFSELQAYLQAEAPYTVIVDHDITTGVTAYVDDLSTGKLCDKQDGSEGVATTYGERILIASNKTLLGVANKETGLAPLFSRITFVMQSVENIIIRNVRFTMNGAPILKTGENKIVAWRDGAQVEVGDPDCISIQADKVSAKTNYGSHIWIDHCEFFNGNAANKDRYDGLLDCKNNVQWMTFSYNYFHNHDKSCLFGKGDGDVFENGRTISFHHNFFENIEGSRLPLQRGSYLHYMNNYQKGCEDGWDIRTGAIGYADACYFESTKSPIRSDRGGSLNINKADGYDIIYTGCNNLMTGYTNADGAKVSNSYSVTSTSWLPTDVDSKYAVNTHDKTADVPTVCTKYSGAGKIVVYSEAIPAEDAAEFAKAAKNYSTAKTYDADGNTYNGEPTTEENDASAAVTIDGTSSLSKTFSATDETASVTVVVTPTRTAATVATSSAAATAVAGQTNTWTISVPAAGESVNAVFTVTAKDGTTTQDYTVTITRNSTDTPDPVDPQPETSDKVYSWNDKVGTTTLVGSAEETTVKTNANSTSTSAIKITSSANDYVIIKPASGSFKAGDIVHVAGVYNNSQEKTTTITVTTSATGNLTDLVGQTDYLINGRTSTADPTSGTFTLTSDCEALYVWRQGNTNTFITTLYVERTSSTGIDSISSDGKNADGKMYDLTGRRIQQPRHGQIYIMGGKKHFMK